MKLRPSHAVLACVLVVSPAVPRIAHATDVDSFSEIPGAVFHNFLHPSACSAHFHDPIPVDLGDGRIVNVTFFSENTQDGSYQVGCVNYSQSLVSYHVPNDPSVDPGDLIGEYQSPTVWGDLILNFSEPLTGFGSTTLIAYSAGTYDPDTFVLYDGPNGTGNVLAQRTSDPIAPIQVRRDFKGAFFESPQIRSVRYLVTGLGIMIDGIALAAPGEPVGVPGDDAAGAGEGPSFGPAMPNPFAGATRLVLAIPRAGHVRVEVFGVDGQRLRTLVEGAAEAGPLALTWDGRNDRGEVLPAGVYLVRASAAGGQAMRRIVLTR